MVIRVDMIIVGVILILERATVVIVKMLVEVMRI